MRGGETRREGEGWKEGRDRRGEEEREGEEGWDMWGVEGEGGREAEREREPEGRIKEGMNRCYAIARCGSNQDIHRREEGQN